ncbi:MAG: phosphotransferase family protein [Gammaproteobacteria bacterium]|nr:phosphotransferase family protein [Gammaproteobacteria bacterium]
MNNQDQELAGRIETVLAARLGDRLGGSPRVERLRRLTAGAANQTWRFDAVGTTRLDCVLRRSPSLEPQAEDAEHAADDGGALTKAGEAQVQEAARRAGVEAAEVLFTLDEADGLGDGYVMLALEGETLARRILRDDDYADARPRLARQCGETLARLHSVDPAGLPELPTSTAASQLERYGEIYRSCEQPVPVFDLALGWLREHLRTPDRVTLVHGDFRNGNLMVGPEGLRAVLDWELAHLGDPMEDLGWICVDVLAFRPDRSSRGRLRQPRGPACRLRGRRRRPRGSGGHALLGGLRDPQVGNHVHDHDPGPSDRRGALGGARGDRSPGVRDGVRSHQSAGARLNGRCLIEEQSCPPNVPLHESWSRPSASSSRAKCSRSWKAVSPSMPGSRSMS